MLSYWPPSVPSSASIGLVTMDSRIGRVFIAMVCMSVGPSERTCVSSSCLLSYMIPSDRMKTPILNMEIVQQSTHDGYMQRVGSNSIVRP